ncbi:MAG: hypothetical protein FWD87_08780 [Spirochaetaceae bacterium]|nr:hypothetical protein [Spirochaetaceae bacterium]
MKKRFMVLGLVMLFAVASLSAQTVDIKINNIAGIEFDELERILVGEFTAEIRSGLEEFQRMNKLARGMSNASSFAADGATQRNFIGYRMFAIGIGGMVGVQAPSFDFVDSLEDFEGENDIFLGISAQALTVSAGVNLGFLVEGLYASAKVGKFSLNDISGFSIDTFSFGLMAHYQLIKPRSTLLASWRGVQVGTGFIYYRGDISFNATPDRITLEEVKVDVMGYGTVSADFHFYPSLDLKLATSGVKIPLEIMTGVRLAVLNLSFGLGVDINVSSNSDLTYRAGGPVDISQNYLSPQTQRAGSAHVEGGTTGGSADNFNFKLMAGVGLTLGPVRLDVPLTYYFGGDGPGANVGVTGAVVF